jgi:hypothetical protein
LYQNDEFICKATKIVTYNEATAEQTDADIEACNDQAKYVSHFDKMAKQGKNDLYVPGIIETSEFEDLDNVEVEVVDTSFMNETEDFEAAELYDEYSEESMRKRALESL